MCFSQQLYVGLHLVCLEGIFGFQFQQFLVTLGLSF